MEYSKRLPMKKRKIAVPPPTVEELETKVAEMEARVAQLEELILKLDAALKRQVIIVVD
jgi:exonuclease VII small subunit